NGQNGNMSQGMVVVQGWTYVVHFFLLQHTTQHQIFVSRPSDSAWLKACSILHQAFSDQHSDKMGQEDMTGIKETNKPRKGTKGKTT
ncbi:hypothetical protein P7K49_016247, partial [Saguinus oedipus]